MVVKGMEAKASPNTTIPFGAGGDTKAHIRAPPTTTILQRPSGESPKGEWENGSRSTTRNKMTWQHKQGARRQRRGSKGGHSPTSQRRGQTPRAYQIHDSCAEKRKKQRRLEKDAQSQKGAIERFVVRVYPASTEVEHQTLPPDGDGNHGDDTENVEVNTTIVDLEPINHIPNIVGHTVWRLMQTMFGELDYLGFMFLLDIWRICLLVKCFFLALNK
jgi:hypothetical protein